MKRLIFFGAGNISQAVISGLVNSGYSKKDIFYIDRNQANSLKLKKLKIKRLELSSSQPSDIFILAVKPKDAIGAYTEICAFVKRPKIIALVAGIKSKKYLAKFSNVELMRVMPNTSSRFNKGITAIHNISASKTTVKKVAKLFNAVGIILEISNESYLDDFTAVSYTHLTLPTILLV